MQHTLEDLKSGKLTGIQHLKIAEQLTDFPEEILSLAATLEILDLSGNQLQSLPPAFAQLQKLKVFFASDNLFTVFPKVLGSCAELEMIGFKANQITHIPYNAFPPKLKWLILTNNQLPTLPETIGNCTRLQKLMLAGNCLTSLPPTLQHCTNLQLIRLSANQFTQLPDWLFNLPSLAWLAFSGNPFVKQPTYVPQAADYHWSDFAVSEQLGSGASGNIFKAHYLPTGEAVALKVFKGSITSDGMPEDEMLACAVAGQHPNLLTPQGLVSGHPDGKQVLMFRLIPPQYQILGKTPSFESCTRDVYASNTIYTAYQVYCMAFLMASVCVQLHENRVCHGDVYAHNILIDIAQNHCLLSDFGAATVYTHLPASYHQPLQQLEVRAYGYLLDDLLHLIAEEEKQHPTILALKQIRDACLLKTTAKRPLFTDIFQQLQHIPTQHYLV